MKISKSVLSSIMILILVLAAGSSLAVTAKDMAEYLPKIILNYTNTEPPTLQDLKKEQGDFHRVQKLYRSDSGQIAAVALICGAGVSSNIATQFANGSAIDIKGFEAIVSPSDPKGSNSVTISVKLRDNQMITAMLLHTEDVDSAKNFLGALDLKGLAGLAETDHDGAK